MEETEKKIKKRSSSFSPRYFILSAAFIVLISLAAFAIPQKAFAAPVLSTEKCSTVNGTLCIKITSISPASPEFPGTFTATVEVTLDEGRENGGTTTNKQISWYANPPAKDLINDANKDGNASSISINLDGNGVGKKTFTHVFNASASSKFTAGENNVNIVSASNYDSGLTADAIAVGMRPFTFTALTAASNDRVKCNAKPHTAGTTGVMDFDFEAVYITASSTAATRPTNVSIPWWFGDGAAGGPVQANGWTPYHKYDKEGTYTVTCEVITTDKVLASGTVNVTAGTGEVGPSGAGAMLDAVGGIIVYLINLVLSILFSIVHGLYLVLMSTLVLPIIDAMLGLRASDFGGTVLKGWTTVRDLTNMFFILALVVIGIATILRIESYNYKKLLGTLILMALLVNFSLVIGQAIIQIADVATNAFTGGHNGIANVVFEKIRNSAGLDITNLWKGMAGGSPNSNSDSFTINQLSATINKFLIISVELAILVTFLVLAGLLVVRFAALWVLLILSPFAYLAFAIPKIRGMATKWWENFLKYAFFAPIMAFFLYLIASLSDVIPHNFTIAAVNVGTDVAADYGSSSALVTLVTNNIHTAVILILLWIGMQATTSMAGIGAGAAMGAFTAAAGLPLAAGKWGGAKGLGYLNKKKADYSSHLPTQAAGWKGRAAGAAYALLNPISAAKGWGERRKGLRETTYTTAQAKGQDVSTRLFTWGKVMPTEEDRAETENIMKYGKDYAHMTKEQKAEQMYKLTGKKGREYEDRRNALMLLTAEGGHIDDIIASKYFMVDERGRGYDDPNHGELIRSKYATPEDVAEGADLYSRVIMEEFFDKTLGRNRKGLRTQFTMEDIGKKNTHDEYGGFSTYEDGEYHALRGQKKGDPSVSRGVVEGEKRTERQVRADSPHVFSSLRMARMAEIDEKGNMIAEDGSIWTPDSGKKVKLTEPQLLMGSMDEFNNRMFEFAFRNARLDNATEHAQGRTTSFMLGGNPNKFNVSNDGYLVGDAVAFKLVNNAQQLANIAFRAFYKSNGGSEFVLDGKGNSIPSPKGFRKFDKDGKVEEWSYENIKDDKGNITGGRFVKAVAPTGGAAPAGGGGPAAPGAAPAAGGGPAPTGGTPPPPPAGGAPAAGSGAPAGGGAKASDPAAQQMIKQLQTMNESLRDAITGVADEIRNKPDIDLGKMQKELSNKGFSGDLASMYSTAKTDAVNIPSHLASVGFNPTAQQQLGRVIHDAVKSAMNTSLQRGQGFAHPNSQTAMFKALSDKLVNMKRDPASASLFVDNSGRAIDETALKGMANNITRDALKG